MQASAASFQQRVETSAPYAALLEESTLAAVRTPSFERRRDIVEILRTGLMKSDAELVGHHALLRLLEGLNEADIIILMSLGSFRQTFGDQELAAFYQKHDAVLGVMPPTLGASTDEHRDWANGDLARSPAAVVSYLAAAVRHVQGWRGCAIVGFSRDWPAAFRRFQEVQAAHPGTNAWYAHVAAECSPADLGDKQ
jgi:hypothetical protein